MLLYGPFAYARCELSHRTHFILSELKMSIPVPMSDIHQKLVKKLIGSLCIKKKEEKYA
ncbi:MAG: hypothetical protein ACFE95_04490 [Candidatus Hodarchaeota archaeon]